MKPLMLNSPRYISKLIETPLRSIALVRVRAGVSVSVRVRVRVSAQVDRLS